MRLGMVGTNFVSDMFMEGVRENPKVEVVAVCSGHYENALKFQKKYNIAAAYESMEEMAEKAEMDAVYIATPNSMHHDHAIFFLNKKIPVYCEKPMATNAREVKEMIEVARKNNTYLMEGLLPMYLPGLDALKSKIADCGPLRNAAIVFCKYSSRYDAYLQGENPTTFRNELSNGAAMDLGVYCLAVCMAVLGKPSKIMANATLLDTGVDAGFNAILQYDDFNAMLAASKCSDTNIFSEISGEKGTIQIPGVSVLKQILFQKRGEALAPVFENNNTPFKYTIENFVRDIEEGKKEPTLYPFDQCIALHETLTEIREQCGVIYKSDMF
ncbi:Gfo/Idh/MocA family protein [Faecalibaculum rodentium]|uniref:Gfo/Idh/MocA family protein n=1 Tax=Faecalibaculum rodentium TaxID=1702221 RepID=UPI00259CB67F|nr:Gfo/Idh/MocA family oxidoreductase [Faecalibaculum rodentium]